MTKSADKLRHFFSKDCPDSDQVGTPAQQTKCRIPLAEQSDKAQALARDWDHLPVYKPHDQ